MGRKKIAIARIADERNRQITFSKRKAGLLKKAYELSILCDCEIAVIMISNNRKLYQYASSNMNSILIRYTEFKDPDESKTNADILDDIQRKERGAQHGDESGGEDDEHSNSMQSGPFHLTPQTQAQYGKMNEEFDTMLHRNQILFSSDQLSRTTGSGGGEVGGARGRGPPRVMPVSVPVAQSPGTTNAHIQQHLAQQMEVRGGGSSANSTSSSGGTMSTIISPQSDMSASPSSAKSLKSPQAMPPPVGTPTRLQTLRNQSLKLHLPGSGRNYISLGSGGNTSPGGSRKGGREGDGEGAGPSGTKPHLRVKIPGQKGFVPRTQATSPLPQMELTTDTISGTKDLPTTTTAAAAAATTTVQRPDKYGPVNQTTAVPTTSTTHTESLTTPVLSLATPNLLSALPPPLFSSLTGDFPFSALMSAGLGGGSGTAGGGGGGSEMSSALVAFPVSIQPSSTSGGGSSAGNIVLQAQNMGQPFLLTPNMDPRQNPMLSQTTFTPPPSSSSSMSPNVRDLEQLKHQYERVHQQLLQQQLFISQQLHHHHHHQQQQVLGKEGGGVTPAIAKKSVLAPPTNKEGHAHHDEARVGEEVVSVRHGAHLVAEVASPSLRESQEEMEIGETVGTPPKRARVEVDTSPEQPTSV